MASLYKKPVMVRDPETGERVKGKSRKWWGRFRDEHGIERRVPLASDRRVAQAMLVKAVKRVERRVAGLEDPFEQSLSEPITSHIDAFEKHQRGKGNTAKHVSEVTEKVRRVARACRWTWLRDIAAGDVQNCLADFRANGLSIQTSNHYLRAVKQFSRWLVRDRRMRDDALMYLSMLNASTDRRHPRRPLALNSATRRTSVEPARRNPTVTTSPDPLPMPRRQGNS